MIERNRPTIVTEAVVENHEAGLLYVEGRLVERLAPGRHAFWIVGRKIEVKRLDLRPQAVEITAQEMLTRDRIALRVTLTAFRRIVDPERVVAAVPDVDAWLYRLVQFAIREAVAGRTLDEVLSAKAALDAELRDYVRARIADSGVEVTELGVKDVILPGEIRELVNKVVEAERVAKANLIRRQEETAATRSLLNTARLMEENPLLLRLKELESLERLVEKVGRIDLHAGDGQGFDALLTKLVRLKPAENGMTRRVAHGRPFIFLFSGITAKLHSDPVPARFQATRIDPSITVADFQGRLDRMRRPRPTREIGRIHPVPDHYTGRGFGSS